jgi:hypothetical protein
LTTAQLRGPRFRRLFPDVYVAADVSVDHYVMCRAAALYAGPAAVISGLSAAYVWVSTGSPKPSNSPSHLRGTDGSPESGLSGQI